MHCNARMGAALIAGGAVMTLGALGIGVAGPRGAQTSYTSTQMSLGSTSTEAVSPAGGNLGEAAPAIKGPAPLPTEEQGLEGIEGRHH